MLDGIYTYIKAVPGVFSLIWQWRWICLRNLSILWQYFLLENVNMGRITIGGAVSVWIGWSKLWRERREGNINKWGPLLPLLVNQLWWRFFGLKYWTHGEDIINGWTFAKVCLNLLNIFAREEMGEEERIGWGWGVGGVIVYFLLSPPWQVHYNGWHM